MNHTTFKTLFCSLAAISLLLAGSTLNAQSSSIYNPVNPQGQPEPLTLQNSSWYYRQLPPPKQIRLNDLITIRVDISSRTIAEGELERRKNALYDAILRDWLILKSIDDVQPSAQTEGSPRARGAINSLFRAEGELETIENVRFDITATVADIRPNGTLVLEAHAHVQNNEEVWEYSLTGLCRPDDIGPDNVIISRSIAELSVYKRERGSVRDSYRRGWFLVWWDWVRLF